MDELKGLLDDHGADAGAATPRAPRRLSRALPAGGRGLDARGARRGPPAPWAARTPTRPWERSWCATGRSSDAATPLPPGGRTPRSGPSPTPVRVPRERTSSPPSSRAITTAARRPAPRPSSRRAWRGSSPGRRIRTRWWMGGASRRLRGLGMPVWTGVLAAETDALNRPFFKAMRAGLPWVTLKAAVSLDGKLATASGDSRWVTGEAARAEVHRLRNVVDAVLVGLGHRASGRPGPHHPAARGRGQGPAPRGARFRATAVASAATVPPHLERAHAPGARGGAGNRAGGGPRGRGGRAPVRPGPSRRGRSGSSAPAAAPPRRAASAGGGGSDGVRGVHPGRAGR